jgi:hypothetical protein
MAQVTSPVGGATFPSQEGFRTTFVVAAAAALLGLFLTALVPARAGNRTAPGPTAQPAHAG